VASARRHLPASSARSGANGGDGDDEDETIGNVGGGGGGGASSMGQQTKQPTVIPGGDLLGDLLDIGGFSPQPLPSYQPAGNVHASAGFDLLGDGLDSLIGGGMMSEQPNQQQQTNPLGMGMQQSQVNI
jgi:hypothetical protein